MSSCTPLGWTEDIIKGIFVTALISLGGILLMVRLMWRDYKKKHRMNGEERNGKDK